MLARMLLRNEKRSSTIEKFLGISAPITSGGRVIIPANGVPPTCPAAKDRCHFKPAYKQFMELTG
jgi:hypothetical protein